MPFRPLQAVRGAWRRVPGGARDVAHAYALLAVGALPPTLAAEANWRWAPAWPWSLPLVCAWLALFWRVAGRSHHACTHGPGPRVWAASMCAGGLATLALRGSADVLRRLAPDPSAGLPAFGALDAYPRATLMADLLATALVAGVAEEVAYRGAMLTALARRIGARRALVVTSVLFTLGHARPSWTFVCLLPAYLGAGFAWGALARLSGSIAPGVWLHVAFDLAGLARLARHGAPTGVWSTGADGAFTLEALAALACAAGAVPAYRALGRIRHAALHDDPLSAPRDVGPWR